MPMALQHVGGGSTLAFSYLSGETIDRGLAAARARNPRISLNIDAVLLEEMSGFRVEVIRCLRFDIK